MFETAFGIPAHPLLIHVPVIFVPLLIIVSLGYALVPFARPKLDWALVALSVLTPIGTFVARASGLAFRARLIREHAVSNQDLAKINIHQGYGTDLLWITIALGVLGLVLVGVQAARARQGGSGGGAVLWIILSALTVVGAALAGYYVFKTGDSGAHIVWQGR